jgi:hypothetical protein
MDEQCWQLAANIFGIAYHLLSEQTNNHELRIDYFDRFSAERLKSGTSFPVHGSRYIVEGQSNASEQTRF